MSVWGKDGFARRPGEGIRVDQGSHWLEVLARGTETDQQMGVFEFRHEPIHENPPHAHLDYMKVMYVLEGHYDLRVGDATFSADPGSLVVVPRGSQHTFTTPTGGRMLFVCSPSGNEEMFLEMGRLGEDCTQAEFDELLGRFRTVVPPGDAGAPWRPASAH